MRLYFSQFKYSNFNQLSDFPFNLIGYIQSKPKFSEEKIIVHGTGFLISNCLVLTSAHDLVNSNEVEDKIMIYQPISFTLIQIKSHQQIKRSSKIKKVTINKNFIDLNSKILPLIKKYYEQEDMRLQDQLKEKIKILQIQTIQSNFALLELQQKFNRPQYFQLFPNFSNTNSITDLVVTGYQMFEYGEYYLFTHSNRFDSISNGLIYYDIDSNAGQTGSPVYIKDTNNVVGIHLGYGYLPNKPLNRATKITQSMIKVLEQWCLDMDYPFKNKNVKKTLKGSINEPNIFPDHCIGQLVNKSTLNKNIIGTGFLIAQCFILTSARIVYQIINNNKFQAKHLAFLMHGDKKIIDIQDYRIPLEFVNIQRQISTLKKQKQEPSSSPVKQKNKQNKIDDLLKEQFRFDYCLLKIVEPISRPYYFSVNQDVSLNPIRTIAGYDERSQYVTHTGKEIDMLYYNLDSVEVQPGSPIFHEKTHNLIGIYQGFSSEDKSGFGTMITSKEIEVLEQWCFEMMPQFTITN